MKLWRLEGVQLGYPVRANIFKPGTDESRDFLRFPIQATVLFSKRNREFGYEFRNMFMHLDQLTGDHVAFFAVLEPPKAWRDLAHGREWWNRHFRSMPVSYDDDVLVLEMARMFGVPWENLPALVVSTDLWNGGHLVLPTSALLIEAHFRLLVQIVERWGRAPLEVIQDEMEAELRCAVHVVPRSDGVATQLAESYELVDVASDGNRRRLHALIRERLNDANWKLYKARPLPRESDNRAQGRESFAELPLSEDRNIRFDRVVEDASGSIVFPSTLANLVHEELQRSENEQMLEVLDDESAIMLMTALRGGRLLEVENQAWGDDSKRWLDEREFRVPRRRPRAKQLPLDWSLACNPAFKAFEREINLSIVQVARQGRGVAMPEFLGRFDPSLPRIQRIVATRKPDGTPGQVSINVRDRFDITGERHRFLMLAEALGVQDALEGKPFERFDSCMAAAGGPLTPDQKQAWKTIKDLRNKGSHISLLEVQEYRMLLDRLFNSGLFLELLRIKAHLLGRETPPPLPLHTPPPLERKVPTAVRQNRLKAGLRVKATLVADPKGRDRPWARLSTGESGRILGEESPDSSHIGDEVDLVIQSAWKTGVSFSWPEASRVQKS